VALGPTNIFAAGVADPASNSDPLLEHWDGTSWTAFHHDSLPADVQTLGGTAIAARSTHDVWLTAVDSHWRPAGRRALGRRFVV
jgi:hypothetical protein